MPDTGRVEVFNFVIVPLDSFEESTIGGSIDVASESSIELFFFLCPAQKRFERDLMFVYRGAS